MKKLLTVILTILLVTNSAFTFNTVRADDFESEEPNEIIPLNEDISKEGEDDQQSEEQESDEVDIVALLASLPCKEEINEENYSDVLNLFNQINEIIDSLSEEEKAELDLENFNELSEFFLNETEEEENKEELETPQDEPSIIPEEPKEEPEEEHILSYIEDDELDISNLLHSEDEFELNNISIPSSYDLRNYGYVTSVKDQDPYGTCWAFAACASAESTYLKKYGVTLDLAELHLAWYGYNSYNKADSQNLIQYDGVRLHSYDDSKTLDTGGNSTYATLILASGLGFNDETDFPYSTASNYKHTTDYGSHCYDVDYYLDNVKWVAMQESSYLKELIMTYGAATTSFQCVKTYFNESYTAYYASSTLSGYGHAVTIVGWDDNYSRYNFKTTPASSGAWLCKNSWGSDWGNNGYFWISYCDKNIVSSRAAVFSVEANNGTTHLYQYDGGINQTLYSSGSTTFYEANVYTAQRTERVKKVGFYNLTPGTSYTVYILTGFQEDASGNAISPWGGSVRASASGTVDYAGYVTVDLNSYPEINQGQKFSVVVKRTGSSSITTMVDSQDTSSTPFNFYSSTSAHQSFYGTSTGSWSDYHSLYRCARIKAFTDTGLTFSCNTPEVNLLVGGTRTLAFFNNLSSNEITGSSSNESVAVVSTVAGSQVISAVGPGTATLTFYCKGIPTTVTVNVATPTPAPSFDISINDDCEVVLECSDSNYLSEILSSPDALKVRFYDGTNTEEFPTNSFHEKDNVTGKLFFDASYLNEATQYTSLELNVKGYSQVTKTISIVTKIIPNDVTFTNTSQGLQITGDSDYISTISGIYIEGNSNNLYSAQCVVNAGTILIPMAVLSEYGIETDTYNFEIYSTDYYKNIKNFNLTVTSKPLPAINAAYNNSTKTSYIITSEKDWIDGLFESYANGSRIKFEYRGVFYDVPSSAITQTNDTTVTINVALTEASLPGVAGRQYNIKLYSYGYAPYIISGYQPQVSNLVKKESDVIYFTYHFVTGDVTQTALRGSFHTYMQAPSIPYKHFVYYVEGLVRMDGSGISTTNSTHDFELTPVYEYDVIVDDVTANVLSGTISDSARVTLSCQLDGATIYYTLNGEDPTVESTVYQDSILIDEAVANEGIVTLKTFAVKENCGDSNITTFTYTIDNGADDWGDIKEEDRTDYTDATEVPNGIWVTGIIDKEYDAKTKKYVQNGYRVYFHKTLLKEKNDYTVSYSNNTKVGTAKLIVKLKGNHSGQIEVPFNINPANLETSFKADLASSTFTYTGGNIKPVLTVSQINGTTKLKVNTDYTFVLENWVDEGEYLLTVTGKGNYTGTLRVTYSITKKTVIDKAKVNGISNVAFDGEEHKPLPTVVLNGITLNKDVDYTVEYQESCVAVGTYQLTITGIGNYAGHIIKTYSITGRNASKFTVSDLPKNVLYGNVPVPTVVYKEGNNVISLTKDVDYRLEYVNSDKVGTATINIVGLESAGYTGVKKVTYKVDGQKISEYSFVNPLANAIYTGEPIVQDIALVKIEKSSGATIPMSTDKGIALNEYKELSEEERLNYNYTIEYKNNVNKGKATVIIAGVNAYTGTISKTFNITAKPLQDLNVSEIETQTYLKGGVKPDVVIMHDDKQLKNGVDYTLKYSNNTSVYGTKIPTVTVTGKGNYSGTIAKQFTINVSDIGNLEMKVNDKAYANKKGNFTQSVTVTDIDGKALKAGTDYEKSIVYTYVNKTILADGTERNAGTVIPASDIVPAGTVIKATVSGKTNYVGSLSKNYRVVAADISKATVTIISQYYSGKAIELDKSQITIKVGSAVLSSRDYEIVSYDKNILAGNASITLKGVGDYGGSKTASFKILAKPALTTIVLNGNGGTGSMNNVTVNGTVTNLPGNTYKRTGYTFIGWNTRPDGAGYTYPNGKAIAEIAIKTGTVKTLYATWHKEVYTITYNVTADVTNPNTENNYSVDTKTITLKTPTRYRYVFEGWYKDAALKNKISAITIGSTGNLTLYPKWSYYEGWLDSETYQKKDGTNATGIFKIGSDEYYFSNAGKLEKNVSVSLSDKYYFTNENGKIVKNTWWNYNDNYYHTDSKGVVETGFKTYKEKTGSTTVSNTYYLDPYSSIPGARQYGWKQVSGKYYYLNEETGILLKKSWTPDHQYYVDDKGIRVTNKIVKIGSNSYYFDENGLIPSEGYVTVGKKTYYVTGDGYLAISTIATIGGLKYYFNANGVRQKGMITYQGKTYIFHWDDYYAITNSWIYTNGKWYISDTEGVLYKNGTYNIYGYDYTFNSKGVCTKYVVYENSYVKITYTGYKRTIWKYLGYGYTEFLVSVQNKTGSEIQYFQTRDRSVNGYSTTISCSDSISAYKTKVIKFTLMDSNSPCSFKNVMYIDLKFYVSYGSTYFTTPEVRIHVNH